MATRVVIGHASPVPYPSVSPGDVVELSVGADRKRFPALIIKVPGEPAESALRACFFNGRLFCNTELWGNLPAARVRKLNPGETVTLEVFTPSLAIDE